MGKLRNERLKRRWSLTHLTCLTGIDTTVLSRLERGRMMAYAGWRKRIAAAFEMPEESLFEEVLLDERQLGKS